MINLRNIDDINKEFTSNVICEQFTRMLINGIVQNYDQFYQWGQEQNIKFSSRIARCRYDLRAIEESERAKGRELPPLKPMLTTLQEYI